MEDTKEMLEAINKEVEESKSVLEDLQNKVVALSDIVLPALVDHAKALRDSRMAVTREVNQSLQAFRDVRKFFLEKDYQEEMARLERLVKLCRELGELKESGILDAVLDSSLRLALGEEAGK